MDTLTVEQAAARLQLSIFTTRKLLRDGKLPGFKIGGGKEWRIRKVDLDAYLNGEYPTSEGQAPAHIIHE